MSPLKARVALRWRSVQGEGDLADSRLFHDADGEARAGSAALSLRYSGANFAARTRRRNLLLQETVQRRELRFLHQKSRPRGCQVKWPRAERIALELIRSNETGLGPNHRRLTLIEIKKRSDTANADGRPRLPQSAIRHRHHRDPRIEVSSVSDDNRQTDKSQRPSRSQERSTLDLFSWFTEPVPSAPFACWEEHVRLELGQARLS
jgi:hypothetical protein